ncbi:hypothetical protein [Bradyrhizobium lablabi]|uniref:hypothetical protein n=1 Tax=Bradyrhizobium lablabi TaxID=722472 RepID=UPI001BAD36BE|nr:hypothetical protein [Bradyrhizobium lablabi]MBR0695217.1 hypothetical protein [Bradyrhizobium lablabi]
MSKRLPNKFPERPLDFFPTPEKALSPLIPFLARDHIRRFAEPCAGDSDFVRHLQARGLICVYHGDIRFGQDALERASYGDIHGIITNPPHTKELLLPLLLHLQNIAPAWLLLTSDFLINQYAAPYLKRCSDVVAIGRLNWVKGTEQSGYDNFVWARFDINHRGNTALHNDRDVCAPMSDPLTHNPPSVRHSRQATRGLPICRRKPGGHDVREVQREAEAGIPSHQADFLGAIQIEERAQHLRRRDAANGAADPQDRRCQRLDPAASVRGRVLDSGALRRVGADQGHEARHAASD